ncbi:MAG: neutral/alkaline non-lysosomal ceramidase N-terminal domain-containing protein [Bryobacteraceae bacterium]
MSKLFFLLLGSWSLAAFGADTTPLRAGAARVDITPAANAALPMSGYRGRKQGFEKIHDNIYVRAIVLDNGIARAAIVTWELIGVPNVLWSEVSQRVAGETGIPVENLLLAGVHDHGAPSVRGGFGETAPNTAAYTEKVEAATIEAVRQAKAKLQPARFGAGTGKAYLNINRREYMPNRGSWGLGRNPDGPSDKSVSVLKFEDMSGKPIAFFINYAVHGVVMENAQITGDLPGATSRFVEQYYSGKQPKPRTDAGYGLQPRPEEISDVVAVWTSGAAGDQNPIGLASGSDFTLVDAQGQILGEEVIRIARGIKTSPQIRIWGAQKVVTCPGSKIEPGPLPNKEYKSQDADPVNIRLSLLMINDIALAGVSGEVLTMIHEHLNEESPFKHTIMVTHANGSSGYIPDDAAYDQVSYEITTTHLKRGCAEGAIVNGFMDLMNRY